MAVTYMYMYWFMIKFTKDAAGALQKHACHVAFDDNTSQYVSTSAVHAYLLVFHLEKELSLANDFLQRTLMFQIIFY